MRVMAINRELALMPCFCLAINMQTSNEVLPTNIPFNGADICNIIIRSLPQDWQTQYRMQCGQRNQTKMRDLLIQLEAIEKVMNQKQKEKDASTKKDPTANPGKKGKCSENNNNNLIK